MVSVVPSPPPGVLFLKSQIARVGEGFVSLKGSPPELWKAYVLKFLDSYAYFSFSLVFTLFLSSDFGFSDVQAGTIYGAWGALITIFGLLTGCIIDNVGVAVSLRVGFCLSLAARVAIFCTASRTVLLSSVLVFLPLGNCLGIPVLSVGIRRYTTDANRGFAFGLFYVVMNVGALFAGPVVNATRELYNHNNNEAEGVEGTDGTDDTDDVQPWRLTSYRLIVLSGAIANVAAVLVAFTVREIKVVGRPGNRDDDNNDDDNDDDNNNEGPPPEDERENNGVSGFRPLRGDARTIFSETMHSPDFRRFLVVCLLTINVRMVFRHLDATLPKYMMREFGPDAPFGLVYSINPFLIILLVPIVTAATTTVNPLVMIHYGTYVSAASVFFLAASTSLWACVAFVVTLSVGESIWSPRLYDYTMSIAPEGREGTYMALSSAPLFLAKLPVGFMSGALLQKFCPAEGTRNSQAMWLIIGLTTATSPILLTLLWGYISADTKKTDHSPVSTNDAADGEITHDNGKYGGMESSSLQHRPLTASLSLPRAHSSNGVSA